MYAKKEFDLAVYTYSDKAKAYKIDNKPNAEQKENLRHLHDNIIVPLLDVIDNGKLYITSGFRCLLLNNQLNGSKTSQHMKGQAVDLIYYNDKGKIDNLTLFDYIRENMLFDQLIWEKKGAWVHVSLKQSGNRKQVLNL